MKRHNPHRLTSLWLGMPLWGLAVVISMVFSDCSGTGRQEAGAPLPPAYPRINLYDTVRVALPQAAPVTLYANAAAEATMPDRDDDKNRWIDIRYPQYKAVVHCTLTAVTEADRDRVIDNRTERMSLNTGGHPTEILTIESPGGFHSQLLLTRAESVTPIQFLSTDGKGWVVSGAVYLNEAPRAAATDSIAPVINAIRDDVVYSLSRLSAK